MSKLKINSGLASVILLACLFSGWATFLTVVILMLIFCEISDSVKQVLIRVITFYFGITLLSMAWGLLVDGVNLVIDSFNDFIGIINSYLTDPISVYKLEAYLLTPIAKVVSLADGIISYLLVFIKFSFILAVLGNKKLKDNFIVIKLNIFVDKVVSFVNSFEMMQNNMQQQSQPQTFDVQQAVLNQQGDQNQIFPH